MEHKQNLWIELRMAEENATKRHKTNHRAEKGEAIYNSSAQRENPTPEATVM